MEPILNEEVTVSQLWQNVDFEGKQQYVINGQDELLLHLENASNQPLLISKLQVNTFNTTIELLRQKFAELQRNVLDLANEWGQSADKLKLVGRLEKTKDYICNAKALGDMQSLLNNVNEKLSSVQSLLNENYNHRLKLVEQAEGLLSLNDLKQIGQGFKDVIEAWKSAPAIDKNKMDQLWQRIDTARTTYFDRKRTQQEEYEQQSLANLDLKLELCEQAEKLSNSTDWKETTEQYKQLTEAWKGVGRVITAEKNDELWNRFITAQNKFFEQKRVHFEQINMEQDENLQQKLAIINRLEEIDIENCSWKETTVLVNELTEAWRNLGRVPKDQADVVWNRFQEAKNRFFDAKRSFTEKHRLTLEDNLAKKQALVNRIERIKNTTQWRETTIEINNLMAEWKSIGPVPREVSEEIWEKFIQARNYFFARKDADRVQKQAQYNAKIDSRIQQTKDFLEKLKFEIEDDRQKIIEFKNNMSSLDVNNPKDVELKNHLQNLVTNIEAKLPTRERKIVEVEAQLQELLQKKEEVDAQKNTNNQPE